MNKFVPKLMPVLLAVAASAVSAAPVGYSVNSDAADGDRLHRIDLATGVATAVSGLPVMSGSGPVERTDIEGLAFDREGTLWAVDEDSMHLFPLNLVSGIVAAQGDVPIDGINDEKSNDFGLTFTCEDQLFASSVISQTLYRLDLDGTATVVGAPGALGHNISALAAWGSPTRLFGLSNGLANAGNDQFVQDDRGLFSIDIGSGVATLIGTLGGAADDYFEAGLSFDTEGNLWALLDRGADASQILQLDTDTGAATLISTASGTGFESLAVAPPGGCSVPPDSVFEPEPIPALDRNGLLLTLLSMLGIGLLALHRRTL